MQKQSKNCPGVQYPLKDIDLQEITKTEVGITKTEVTDFWLLYKYKSLTIYLNRPIVPVINSNQSHAIYSLTFY